MQLQVLDMHGTKVGTLNVSDQLFAVPMNVAVVHQAMLRQRNNARQGTASTKTRAQVSGGGAKPRPQKGTGRSRQGTIRSPLWRGGGIVFGPTPRSFRQRIPKKMRRLAIRCLLSDKVKEDRLIVVQDMDIPEAKTKEIRHVLQALGATSSALLVTNEVEEKVVLAARNLDGIRTLCASHISVLDLLDYDRLIITVEAVRRTEDLWGGGATPEEVVLAPKRRPTRSTLPRSRKVDQSTDEISAGTEEA